MIALMSDRTLAAARLSRQRHVPTLSLGKSPQSPISFEHLEEYVLTRRSAYRTHGTRALSAKVAPSGWRSGVGSLRGPLSHSREHLARRRAPRGRRVKEVGELLVLADRAAVEPLVQLLPLEAVYLCEPGPKCENAARLAAGRRQRGARTSRKASGDMVR